MAEGDDRRSAGFGLIEDEDPTPPPNRRAAVIVGVSTSAGLTPLTSAGPMARSLGDWLSTAIPGYDVTVITDENGHAVTPDEIFDAISTYVTVPARYELLLVHYIGHGFYQARNDIWMLSRLPNNRSACISLTATLNDAKFSGIPNVVVVSDACRVLPGDLDLSDLSPTAIIPYLKEFSVETTCVDYFQAAGRGTPAFEGEIEGARRSFLSHAFREAYRNPRPEMVCDVLSPMGAPIRVVPNRRLGDFLKEEVARVLGASDAAKSQQVVPVVPSDDNIFIAPVDVAGEVGVTPGLPTEKGQDELMRRTRSTPGGKIKFRPRKSPLGPTVAAEDGPSDGALSFEDVAIPPETETEVERLLRRARRNDWPEGQDPRLRFAPPSGPGRTSVPDLETRTGLTLTGASISRAAMTYWPTQGAFAELAAEKDKEGLSVLKLHSAPGAVGELAVGLDDGRCILLPVMEGYICHVIVDATGVQGLSWVPAQFSWRVAGAYQTSVSKIERLRALATEAMNERRFHVGSEAEAERLAKAIRNGKAHDPVLGLLAAQAYSEARMPDRVRSVSDYMRADIRADLFDVRLLANRFWQDDPTAPVVPRCPMLTQNWALLEPRRVSLPAALAGLQPFLTDALWTTFAPGAAALLFNAIEKGDL